jgi:hypothetical protein
MKFNIIVLLLSLFSLTGFSQFRTTSDSKIIHSIPKAQNFGDTVYSKVPNGQHSEGYRLLKIRKDGYYVFEALIEYATKYLFVVNYNALGEITSYSNDYKIKGIYGDKGHAYFEIAYYPNGNIRYYLIVGKSKGEYFEYDSLDYVEQDRNKIPYKELRCFKFLGKWYRTTSQLSRDEMDKLKRRGIFYRHRFMKKNKVVECNLEDSHW